MALEAYRKKRNFKQTSEPSGRRHKTAGGNLYLIQKHAASRLHYDFRLELNGVLLSWAVPRGPSFDPHEKRLAVRVEDHPIEYGDFEGIIPEGQYGGGTVLLWDRGTWTPQGDAETMLREGILKFVLTGTKLKGHWTLIRMGHSDKPEQSADEQKNWLLIKEKDGHVRAQREFDVTRAEPNSVASGRGMQEIAAQQDRVWNSAPASRNEARAIGLKPSPKARQSRTRGTLAAANLPGARKASLPRTFSPQLAMLAATPPTGEAWIHEIKYDGYRMLCRIERGKVEFISRNGKAWTSKFPRLVAAAAALPDCMLDGEVVVLAADGLSRFSAIPDALQGRIKTDFTFFVFDLPFYAGYDLQRVPLLQRKQLLEQLLATLKTSGGAPAALRLSEHIVGHGESVYQNACRLGMEGIICKRADSAYASARNRAWLKVKCAKRQEFVIGGWTEPAGARAGFGALLLGVYQGNDLLYSGRVGTGFDDRLLRELHGRMKKLEQSFPSFTNPPRGAQSRGVHWIKPGLVCEVSFTEWTDDHAPRHPSFQGLREDKSPREVKRERAETPPTSSSSRGPTPRLDDIDALEPRPEAPATPNPHRRRAMEELNIGGVRLSHPERILYPDQQVTKRQLAEYYATVSDWILPHIVGRPLSLVRCPDGWNQKCFFQKHLNATMPEALRGIEIAEANNTETCILLDDLKGLISLVQMGVLELHPWGSREPHIEKPDRVVMDLDPDEGLPWTDVIAAAFLLRDELEALGLSSWVKTSGGKGLHVVVPLTPRDGWDEVKTFAKALTDRLVALAPQKYVGTMSKQKRKGKIYIDYLRNSRGATSVAAYSTRARAGAPVSTPIAWDELTPDLRADTWSIANLPARLNQLKADPWADMARTRQSLTKTLKKKLGLA